MLPLNYGTQWKVVLIGAASSGKTSILRRLIFGSFPDDVTPTLGAALSTYQVKCGTSTVNMNVWDTAGQESYRSLAKLYYRDAKAAVVVFDVCSIESFREVEFWIGELDVSETFGHYVVIVGNKVDRQEDRVVSVSDAQALAAKSGAAYLEASAKTGEGITQIFEKIAEHFLSISKNEGKADQQRFAPKKDTSSCC